MKKIFFLILILFISNCSLNNDSKYWNEDNLKRIDNEKKLTKILKKTNDITTMTLNEYEIYIDDYTKKSNYPDINK